MLTVQAQGAPASRYRHVGRQPAYMLRCRPCWDRARSSAMTLGRPDAEASIAERAGIRETEMADAHKASLAVAVLLLGLGLGTAHSEEAQYRVPDEAAAIKIAWRILPEIVGYTELEDYSYNDVYVRLLDDNVWLVEFDVPENMKICGEGCYILGGSPAVTIDKTTGEILSKGYMP